MFCAVPQLHNIIIKHSLIPVQRHRTRTCLQEEDKVNEDEEHVLSHQIRGKMPQNTLLISDNELLITHSNILYSPGLFYSFFLPRKLNLIIYIITLNIRF
jgi:hypothetical protein